LDKLKKGRGKGAASDKGYAFFEIEIEEVLEAVSGYYTVKKIKLIKLQDYSILRQPRLDIPGASHKSNCTR